MESMLLTLKAHTAQSRFHPLASNRLLGGILRLRSSQQLLNQFGSVVSLLFESVYSVSVLSILVALESVYTLFVLSIGIMKYQSDGDHGTVQVDVHLSDSSRPQEDTAAENLQKARTSMMLAPEQELTIVALRLAVLEKAATGLGMLAFVWATVVLLGGFVSNIKPFDFWVISALLLTEGTRVFSRSHELEWQHAAAGSIKLRSKMRSASSILYTKSSDAFQAICSALVIHKPSDFENHNEAAAAAAAAERPPTPTSLKKAPVAEFRGFHIKRTWSWSSVPFIPYSKYFSARHISFLLHLLQLGSAIVTIGFSLARLIKHDYASNSASQVQTNLASGLNIFYSLSLSEASIFLVERAYWEYSIIWKELLLQVAEKSQLGEDLLDIIKQFFYDVYSRCLSGSIFDGLDLDLVTYSISKIQSNSGKEQLGGALMLSKFVTQEEFLEDTLRKIGTTPGATERLLEMITWRNKHEKEIRRAAAKILCQLVIRSSNSFRVMAIAGALEGILSLLVENEDESEALLGNELKLHGLRILKNLAKDDKNCVQIGNTRGILGILVSNIEVKDIREVKKMDQISQVKIFKKTLQLLGRLVSAKGEHGKALRSNIVRIVFTIRNLRDVLQYGESHPLFRELAVDIIKSLALDESIRERIGGTGGVMQNLLTLFFKEIADESSIEYAIRLKAGEALRLLVLKSPKNSSRISTDKNASNSVQKFIKILKDSDENVSTCAATILRSLCAYLDGNGRQEIVAATPWLVKALIEARGKKLEAILGLAASTIPLLSKAEFDAIISEEPERHELVSRVMRLTFDPPPSLQFPMIRRHTLELATVLMRRKSYFLHQFKAQGIERQLEKMLDTVSDVENFITFSGMMGITSHSQTMEDLIRLAIQQVETES